MTPGFAGGWSACFVLTPGAVESSAKPCLAGHANERVIVPTEPSG